MSTVSRAQAALAMQSLMADVALHRLGLLSDRFLDIAFEKEPELNREVVESLVDEAIEAAKTETREAMQARGERFWEAFYAAAP